MQTFPDGKYKGSRFHVALDDPKYCSYIMSHKNLKSPWALSFLNFLKAIQDMKNEKEEEDEWQTVEDLQPSQASTDNAKGKTKGNKRSMNATAASMSLDIDKDKEINLMAQVAILQRELDRVRGEVGIPI